MNIPERLVGSALPLLFANLLLAQQPPAAPQPVLAMPPAPEPAAEQIYSVVEQMPEFPGGQEALYQYLRKSIRYPEAEREAGIEGKVYLSYVVEKDGTVRDIKVLRGVPGGPGLETESIRVVEAMPKWIPGMLNGKPVAVRMNLPVSFRLSEPVRPPAEK